VEMDLVRRVTPEIYNVGPTFFARARNFFPAHISHLGAFRNWRRTVTPQTVVSRGSVLAQISNKEFEMVSTTRMLLTAVLAIGAILPVHSQAQTDGSSAAGAVFVMTNAAGANEILTYKRGTDGSLREGRSFQTGGRGSGGTTDPLGSQGSLTLSQDHSLLFAVNAGSGDISVFRIHGRLCHSWT